MAKINVAVMELEETLYWLELLEGSEVFSVSRLENIQQETGELIAVLITVAKNAKQNDKV